MAWTLTDDVAAYDIAAGPLLSANPEKYTVLLTVLAQLRRLGIEAFGAHAPLLGWWSPGARSLPGGDRHPGASALSGADCSVEAGGSPNVDGTRACAAVLHTPPYPMLITELPGASAAELARDLANLANAPSSVNGREPDTMTLAHAWSELTWRTFRVHQRQRLHRLGTLTPPDPGPAGAARVATIDDAAIVKSWVRAFAKEAGQEVGPSDRVVGDRLDAGQLMLWQVAQEPVALAGVSEVLYGVARVGPVYTPPDRRGRGYGGAVTTAISRLATDRGARSVVLFTDLANPVSNSLYFRLGYRPVEDRVVLSLG